MSEANEDPTAILTASDRVLPGKPSTWRWPEWGREAVLVVAILTAVTCLFYYEIVFLGRTLLPLQVEGVMGQGGPYGFEGALHFDRYRLDNVAPTWQFEPLTRKAGEEFASGRFPLWNDNQAFGMPLLADAVSGTLSLLHAPLFLDASPLMWDLYYLARTILAALATYLFARIVGLAVPARFFFAIAYVFSGFFVLYMPNHFVETYFLLPVILLGTELMLGRHLRLGFALTALAVGLNLLTGMPESSLAVLLLCAAYGAYQLLVLLLQQGLHREWVVRAALLGGAWVAGIALSAPLLLPLFEFVSHSSMVATRRAEYGLNHAQLPLIASWYMPFVRGFPLWLKLGSATYVGATVLVLAIYGLYPFKSDVYRRLVPFAGLAAGLMLAKTFGVPGINELGRLPGLNVTHFVTWFSPVLAFCLIVLASVGVHHLTVAPVRPLAAGSALAGVLVLVALGLAINRDDIMQGWGQHVYFAVSVVLIFSLVTGLVMITRRLSPSMRGAACCVLVVGELFLLSPHGVYPDRYDRFAEAPYVAWLKQQAETSRFRIFATDGVLHPNFAAAFGLHDIRALTALYVDRSWAYLREFISPQITDRFVGTASADGEDTVILDNPWFDLAGVRYIVTPPTSPAAMALGGRSIIRDLQAAAQAGPVDRATRVESITIDDETKTALIEPLPGEVHIPARILTETPVLRFSLAVPPEAWEMETGDGVAFRIGIITDGTSERVYRRRVDPQNNPAERRWIDDSVDLSRFIGQDVMITLITDPLGIPEHDMAIWGDIRLEPVDLERGEQYSLVYDAEVKIFENQQVMPRAFLVTDVIAVEDIDAALAAMTQDGFDPGRVAVVEGPPESQVAALGPAAGSASLVAYDAQNVTVVVEAGSPSLLVLTDTMYPGWKATVNGEEAPIYATDVAFRGVFVPEGTHQVVFSYDPVSFRLGLGIAGVAGLGLIAVFAGITPRRWLVRV